MNQQHGQNSRSNRLRHYLGHSRRKQTRSCSFQLLIAITLGSSVVGAAEPLARWYLMSWDSLTRVAPLPAQVREWADARCTITSATQLTQLKRILRLERLRSGRPPTRDLRFVVDIRRGDGGLESYYADRFSLMSADYNRWRKIGGGFRREIDSFVQSCSLKSSNQSLQPTVTCCAFTFFYD